MDKGRAIITIIQKNNQQWLFFFNLSDIYSKQYIKIISIKKLKKLC